MRKKDDINLFEIIMTKDFYSNLSLFTIIILTFLLFPYFSPVLHSERFEEFMNAGSIAGVLYFPYPWIPILVLPVFIFIVLSYIVFLVNFFKSINLSFSESGQLEIVYKYSLFHKTLIAPSLIERIYIFKDDKKSNILVKVDMKDNSLYRVYLKKDDLCKCIETFKNLNINIAFDDEG